MGVHRYLLVTSNFHTARAGTHVPRRMRPTSTCAWWPRPTSTSLPDGWWRNREARKRFLIEWEKTLATAAGL